MVYTQAALDSLLACFHFLVFFLLSRWEIFTLLFPTVIPVHLPAKPPGSSTACQIPCAGPLDPTPRLGVHPTALPSTRNFHLVPFFMPTSLGTPWHVWFKDQELSASPGGALGFLSLQELDAPGHASAPHTMGRGKVPKSSQSSGISPSLVSGLCCQPPSPVSIT